MWFKPYQDPIQVWTGHIVYAISYKLIINVLLSVFCYIVPVYPHHFTLGHVDKTLLFMGKGHSWVISFISFCTCWKTAPLYHAGFANEKWDRERTPAVWWVSRRSYLFMPRAPLAAELNWQMSKTPCWVQWRHCNIPDSHLFIDKNISGLSSGWSN